MLCTGFPASHWYKIPGLFKDFSWTKSHFQGPKLIYFETKINANGVFLVNIIWWKTFFKKYIWYLDIFPCCKYIIMKNTFAYIPSMFAKQFTYCKRGMFTINYTKVDWQNSWTFQGLLSKLSNFLDFSRTFKQFDKIPGLFQALEKIFANSWTFQGFLDRWEPWFIDVTPRSHILRYAHSWPDLIP